jgi:hypothetical protein
MNKNRLGSNFDDFLKEKRLLETTEAIAIKRVFAFKSVRLSPKRKTITKTPRKRGK